MDMKRIAIIGNLNDNVFDYIKRVIEINNGTIKVINDSNEITVVPLEVAEKILELDRGIVIVASSDEKSVDSDKDTLEQELGQVLRDIALENQVNLLRNALKDIEPLDLADVNLLSRKDKRKLRRKVKKVRMKFKKL